MKEVVFAKDQTVCRGGDWFGDLYNVETGNYVVSIMSQPPPLKSLELYDVAILTADRKNILPVPHECKRLIGKGMVRIKDGGKTLRWLTEEQTHELIEIVRKLNK